MAGIGMVIRTASKVAGRILGRVAGPLGVIVTIGELGYFGLKYSGTLDNFKKLYCDRCRAEIPMKYISGVSAQYEPGKAFEVLCPHCRKEHLLANISLRCSNCRAKTKGEPKKQNIILPTQAKFLFLSCPQCQRAIRLTRNKYYTPDSP